MHPRKCPWSAAVRLNKKGLWNTTRQDLWSAAGQLGKKDLRNTTRQWKNQMPRHLLQKADNE